MRGMLPGETHSAVDLNVLRGGMEEGLRAVRPRNVRCSRELLLIGVRRAEGRVVCSRARELDLDQHVGALMFDRLERSDRPPELKPGLRVFNRLLEECLR